MGMFAEVTEEHVRAAIGESDELGADVVRQRYGFRQPREYVLWHDGASYDPKAILAVALKHATGTTVRSSEFGGGADGAAGMLAELGFEVLPDKKDDPLVSEPPDGTWQDAAEVGIEPAREAWAESARTVLLDVAKRYHALITYKELAALVQLRTGVRTQQPMHYWIGDVLGRVSRDSAGRDEPLLSSLCVNASGSVGAGYAAAVRDVRGELAGDADDHAAEERLACYRHFGATVPDDGGTPALTPALAAARARESAARQAQRPESQICPTCHMAIPSTGVCDNCG